MLRYRIGTILVACLGLFLIRPALASAEGATTHSVQAGDTLASIARMHGTSVSLLMQANSLTSPDIVRTGQRLAVPEAAAVTAGPTRPVVGASSGAVIYTVKRGQALWQIAALFNTSASAIARANGLANPNLIYPGMRLRIPGGNQAGSGGTAGQAPTRFVASISQQRCWLYQNGRLTGDWPCSTGRPGSPTLPGSYRIQSRINPAYASTWDFWMPYWLGIYYAGRIENGIHGLPYNPVTGRTTWAGLVGTPITYGCIMLENADARKVYQAANIGMPVIVLP